MASLIAKVDGKCVGLSTSDLGGYLGDGNIGATIQFRVNPKATFSQTIQVEILPGSIELEEKVVLEVYISTKETKID